MLEGAACRAAWGTGYGLVCFGEDTLTIRCHFSKDEAQTPAYAEISPCFP